MYIACMQEIDLSKEEEKNTKKEDEKSKQFF